MRSAEMDTQVAEIILEQLGGMMFIKMTGARELKMSESALSFRLPDAGKSITHVEIELAPMDVYTVTFWDCRTTPAFKREIVAKHEDVYCDDLQNLFTSETGLYTHF